MSAACSMFGSETLSSYVDRELEQTQTREVEAHLEHCGHCQKRLESLSRVSASLRSLERLAPPPILDEMVLGQLEVAGARSWSSRLDRLLAPSQRTRATIGPVFAIVMMLVLLVFFFAEAQVRRSNQPIVIALPSLPTPELVKTNSGLSFVEVGGQPWTEVSAAVGASRVYVEESVAEHFALSHAPAGATALVLVEELPPCQAATTSEAEALAQLRPSGLGSERSDSRVLALTRAESGLRCLVLSN